MSVLQLPSLPTSYRLDDLAVLQVSGEDRKEFLQGQLTCNLDTLDIGAVTLGAQCNPQGKVISTFYLLADHDAYFIITNKDILPQQHGALNKYAAFSKVELELADHIQIYGVAGQGTDAWVQAQQSLDTPYFAVSLESNRWLWISIVPVTDHAEFVEGAQKDWWGFEILSGYPHLKPALVEQFIPQMLNLQALDAVSFDKGCYTGQETVARAKYRGANNRALFILEGYATVTLLEGIVLEKSLDDNWRRSGTVLNIWQNEDQVLISAILPTDTAMQDVFRAQSDPSSQFSIRPLPYTLEEAS